MATKNAKRPKNGPGLSRAVKKCWATWKDVKAWHMASGMSQVEAEAQRDGYCIRAHGRVISYADLTDDEAGDILKEFALVLQPDSIDAQLAPTSGEARKRAQCVFSIEKEQPHPGWAAGVSQDVWHCRDWKNLPYADLLTLRRRVGNEARGYTIPGGNSRRRRQPIGITEAGTIVTTSQQEEGDPF